MRKIHDFCDLREFASRLANPLGYSSQVRTQVLVLQTCVDLRVCLARALETWLAHGWILRLDELNATAVFLYKGIECTKQHTSPHLWIQEPGEVRFEIEKDSFISARQSGSSNKQDDKNNIGK